MVTFPVASSDLQYIPANIKARREAMNDPGTVIIRAVLTGEHRPPLQGEWYISGAIPEAYCARIRQHNTTRPIARLVFARKLTTYEIIEQA